jgi:hypothetical protein
MTSSSRLRQTLGSDWFLDAVLDLLEKSNGQPLNLARWDLKAAIAECLDREVESGMRAIRIAR